MRAARCRPCGRFSMNVGQIGSPSRSVCPFRPVVAALSIRFRSGAVSDVYWARCVLGAKHLPSVELISMRPADAKR